MNQKIYVGIGQKGDIETVVKLLIEDHNRDEVKEIINDAIDLIYDGVGGDELIEA